MSRSSVVRLVLYLLQLMPSLKQPQFRSYVPYFDLLLEIARTGSDERYMLIANGTISYLIDFFVEPPPARVEIRLPPGNAGGLCALLSLLLRTCSTDHLPFDAAIHNTRGRGSIVYPDPPIVPVTIIEGQKPPAKKSGQIVNSGNGKRDIVPRLPLLQEGRAKLLARLPPGVRERVTNFSTATENMGLIPLMLLDPSLTSSLVEIVVHWSWGDIPFSKGVIEVCLAQLAKQMTGSQDFRSSFRVLSALVEMGDAYQVVRMEMIFTRLFAMMKGDNSVTGRFLLTATKSILALATQSKAVGEWLLRERRWVAILDRYSEMN